MEAGTQDPPTAAVKHTAAMPPRPDLSNFMMGAGFMLTPTKFLEGCQERCGDYFTLRPGPDIRPLVVTCDPAAVKQVFTGDPNVLHAGEGNAILAPILGCARCCCSTAPSTCASAGCCCRRSTASACAPTAS